MDTNTKMLELFNIFVKLDVFTIDNLIEHIQSWKEKVEKLEKWINTDVKKIEAVDFNVVTITYQDGSVLYLKYYFFEKEWQTLNQRLEAFGYSHACGYDYD